jgi:hypothetical protein
VALAVDIDQFGSLTDRLQAAGWASDPKREERWVTKTGARIDLLTICRCRSFRLQVRAWNRASSLYRAARSEGSPRTRLVT